MCALLCPCFTTLVTGDGDDYKGVTQSVQSNQTIDPQPRQEAGSMEAGGILGYYGRFIACGKVWDTRQTASRAQRWMQAKYPISQFFFLHLEVFRHQWTEMDSSYGGQTIHNTPCVSLNPQLGDGFLKSSLVPLYSSQWPVCDLSRWQSFCCCNHPNCVDAFLIMTKNKRSS